MGLNIWAPSRLPDVDQMARQAPWRKEHHVDSDIIARSGEARSEHFGGGGDAAQAIRVDSEVEVFGPVAPLDLDEGDHPPASRDEVDFAGGDAAPPAQSAPAVGAQPPGGDRKRAVDGKE